MANWRLSEELQKSEELASEDELFSEASKTKHRPKVEVVDLARVW